MIQREDGFVKYLTLSDDDFLDLENENSRILPFVSTKNASAFEVDDRLVKSAACSEAIEFALSLKPKPGRRLILSSALGDFDVWGINKKSDTFPREAILGQKPKCSPHVYSHIADKLPSSWGYKTFVTTFNERGEQTGGGNSYLEHVNTIRYSKGFIYGAFWNQKMYRVELVQDLVINLMPQEVIYRIDHCLPVGISMACRVPGDRCSVCDNIAKRQVDYCEHLNGRNPNFKKGMVLSNPYGRYVAMINDYPGFFDSSVVRSPAADEGMVLKKIASSGINIPHPKTSLELGINSDPYWSVNKVIKDANIELANKLQEARLYEKPFSKHVCEKLSKYPLPDLFCKLANFGIVPTGEDIANIIFPLNTDIESKITGYQVEKNLLPALSNSIELDKSTILDFEKISDKYTVSNEKIASSEYENIISLITPYLMTKSYLPEYFISRPNEKTSSFINLNGDTSQMNNQAKTLLLIRILNMPKVIESLKTLSDIGFFSKGYNLATSPPSPKMLPVYDSSQKYLDNKLLERYQMFYS